MTHLLHETAEVAGDGNEKMTRLRGTLTRKGRNSTASQGLELYRAYKPYPSPFLLALLVLDFIGSLRGPVALFILKALG